MPVRLDAAGLRDRGEDPSIVQSHAGMLQAQRADRLTRSQNELDLRHLRADTENIDVALGELAKAPLLRPLGAPHRTDLDRLERIRELRVVVSIVARERHGQIEPQAEVGELRVSTARGRLELRAPLQNLEDQLLVLAAVARQQETNVLERRRFDTPEAVPPIDVEDLRRRMIPQFHLSRQQVAHAPRR